MPANVTDFSSPSNYTAVWIHHLTTSTITGDNNSSVPTSLAEDNSRLGAWTLIINGAAHINANEIIVSGVPVATNTDSSRYDIGDLILNKIYEQVTSTNITETTTQNGHQFQAAMVGTGRNPTTAWVSGTGAGAVSGADIWAVLTDGGNENWGIIYNGTYVTARKETSDYSGYDVNGNPQFTADDGTIYTRWQIQYNKDGAIAYSVRKKLPDVTTTTTSAVPQTETTHYDFYEVAHTSAAEIAQFTASVVLVIPQHMMQRNITTAAGNMSNGAYNLDNMFIRMSPHMTAARLEQNDLYNNYGVESKLIPVNFYVGVDQIAISLNQIRDVNATLPADKEILQYNNSKSLWENVILNSDDVFEGTTNQFFSDDRIQTYLTTNSYATESYADTSVTTAINNLLDGAPTALDTLNELAAALGDDENYAATLTTQISNLGIADLSDTSTTAPTLGQALVWEGTAWTPTTLASSLSDLSDTSTTAPTLGQALVWEGTAWTPTTLASSLSDLSDTVIATPVADQVLKYNGTSWVNESMVGGATIGTAPATPLAGQLWFDDTNTGELFAWGGNAWLQMTSGSSGAVGGGVVGEGWIATLGGGSTENDRAYGVAVDSSDEIVITGAKDFQGVEDLFVAKYDVSGGLLWDRKISGTGDDLGSGVAIDSTGAIYVSGSTSSHGAGSYDMLVVKYNSSGTLQWSRTLGGTEIEGGQGVAIDSSDNIVLVGRTNDGTGTIHLLVAKYNSSGTLQWTKILGGVPHDSGNGVAVDSSDNIVLVGETQTDGAGGKDASIVKYNSSGTLQWARTLGGTGHDYGRDIAIDSTDNIYVQTQTDSETSNHDCVVAKYNSSGVLQWSRLLSGPSNTYPEGIVVNSSDDVIVSGGSYNATFASGGTNHIFVVKYNSIGTLQWQKALGSINPSTGHDQGYALALDSSDNILVTGQTSSDGSGGNDIVLVKLDPEGNNNGSHGVWTFQDGWLTDTISLTVSATSSTTDAAMVATDVTPTHLTGATASLTESAASMNDELFTL